MAVIFIIRVIISRKVLLISIILVIHTYLLSVVFSIISRRFLEINEKFTQTLFFNYYFILYSFSTITPNTVIPRTACEVQKELGAVNATCFDISAACSGFVYAYNTAQAYIAAGMYQNILVIGSETLSGIVNWKDRGSCILFGDGAGAAVICAEEGEIFPAVTHSDGAKGQVLACESRQQKNWQDKENEKQTYVSMDGQAVFKFAVKKVPEVIGELLQKADLTEKDIDLFVLHQANLRIIESVAKRMKTDLAKFPVNIEEYGNTSSASIPILLDELNKTGRFHKGQKIVLCGFGAGLTWGATLIEW